MAGSKRDGSPAPRPGKDARTRRKEREAAFRREDRSGVWWSDPIEALTEWIVRLWTLRDDEKARRRIAKRVAERKRRRGRDEF